MSAPVSALALVPIVRPTHQDESLNGVPLGAGPRLQMVEFEKLPGSAEASACADVLAPPTVPFNNLAPELRGNMAGRLARPAVFCLLGRTRSCCLGELSPLHLLEQDLERPLEDPAEISVRDLMAEQRLDLPELVMRCPVGSELNLEALLSQGLRCWLRPQG